MQRDTVLGFALCGAAMVTVGSTVVASKFIAAGLPPFTATALRFALALPCFLLLLTLERTPLPRPGRRDVALLVVQAALGSVGYTVLLISGLRFASAADAAVVAGTLTPVAAVLAVLVLREQPASALAGAVLLATLGVLAVTLGGADGGMRVDVAAVAGNAFVLAAVVCEAVFLLLNKRLRTPLPPLAQSAAMTSLGLLVALPFAMLERPWATSADPAAVLAVAYYALVPTVAGFLLWYAGAARLTGAQAALATAVLPVSGVLLAALVLGEAISATQLLGAALVLTAVGLGARAEDPRRV